MSKAFDIEKATGGGVTVQLPTEKIWLSEHTSDFRNVFRLRDPEAATSQIYFFYCGGFVKIGMSKKIIKRLTSLKIGMPWPAHMIAIIPGGRNREGFLHFCFREYHFRGEWFHMSEEIRTIVREFGIPECVDWLDREHEEHKEWIKNEALRLGIDFSGAGPNQTHEHGDDVETKVAATA